MHRARHCCAAAASFAVLGATLLAGSTRVAAASPVVTDLGSGFPEALNSFGQVVVETLDGLHSSLWTPALANGTSGSAVDLNPTPGVSTNALAINATGAVVGSIESGTMSCPPVPPSTTPTSEPSGQAFLWTPASPNGNSG